MQKLKDNKVKIYRAPDNKIIRLDIQHQYNSMSNPTQFYNNGKKNQSSIQFLRKSLEFVKKICNASIEKVSDFNEINDYFNKSILHLTWVININPVISSAYLLKVNLIQMQSKCILENYSKQKSIDMISILGKQMIKLREGARYLSIYNKFETNAKIDYKNYKNTIQQIKSQLQQISESDTILNKTIAKYYLAQSVKMNDVESKQCSQKLLDNIKKLNTKNLKDSNIKLQVKYYQLMSAYQLSYYNNPNKNKSKCCDNKLIKKIKKFYNEHSTNSEIINLSDNKLHHSIVSILIQEAIEDSYNLKKARPIITNYINTIAKYASDQNVIYKGEININTLFNIGILLFTTLKDSYYDDLWMEYIEGAIYYNPISIFFRREYIVKLEKQIQRLRNENNKNSKLQNPILAAQNIQNNEDIINAKSNIIKLHKKIIRLFHIFNKHKDDRLQSKYHLQESLKIEEITSLITKSNFKEGVKIINSAIEICNTFENFKPDYYKILSNKIHKIIPKDWVRETLITGFFDKFREKYMKYQQDDTTPQNTQVLIEEEANYQTACIENRELLQGIEVTGKGIIYMLFFGGKVFFDAWQNKIKDNKNKNIKYNTQNNNLDKLAFKIIYDLFIDEQNYLDILKVMLLSISNNKKYAYLIKDPDITLKYSNIDQSKEKIIISLQEIGHKIAKNIMHKLQENSYRDGLQDIIHQITEQHQKVLEIFKKSNTTKAQSLLEYNSKSLQNGIKTESLKEFCQLLNHNTMIYQNNDTESNIDHYIFEVPEYTCECKDSDIYQ